MRLFRLKKKNIKETSSLSLAEIQKADDDEYYSLLYYSKSCESEYDKYLKRGSYRRALSHTILSILRDNKYDGSFYSIFRLVNILEQDEKSLERLSKLDSKTACAFLAHYLYVWEINMVNSHLYAFELANYPKSRMLNEWDFDWMSNKFIFSKRFRMPDFSLTKISLKFRKTITSRDCLINTQNGFTGDISGYNFFLTLRERFGETLILEVLEKSHHDDYTLTPENFIKILELPNWKDLTDYPLEWVSEL